MFFSCTVLFHTLSLENLSKFEMNEQKGVTNAKKNAKGKQNVYSLTTEQKNKTIRSEKKRNRERTIGEPTRYNK